jgi:hypothetical protein
MPPTYRRLSIHLDFLWFSTPSSGAEAVAAAISRDGTMAFATDFEILFDRLSDTWRGVLSSSADLFAKVVAGSRRPVSILGKSDKTSRVDSLIKADAWTEEAFALIELELPTWKLRRLVYEDGEWRCSLSRHPNLPLALDDSIDASHESLPLAVLQAIFEARLSDGACDATSPVPQIRSAGEIPICCDNFM